MSSGKFCPSCECESVLVDFKKNSYEIGRGESTSEIENISGEICNACGEEFLSKESAERIANFIDSQSRKKNGEFIKNVRKNRLNITQTEAVKHLSGGGHNAFSRYENGEVSIPKPLLVLMHVLDKNPDIYQEIKSTKIRM